MNRSRYWILRAADRVWLPSLFVMICIGTYSNVMRATSPRTMILAAIWSLLFFFIIWRLVFYLQRIIDQNDHAFKHISQTADANFPTQVSLLKAAGSLADTMEVIKRELLRNTEMTEHTVEACDRAATVATTTAADLAATVQQQRDLVREDLDADHRRAAIERENILKALADVHETTKEAVKEANHVNQKIADVHQNVLNLNERLLHEETKTDAAHGPQPPSTGPQLASGTGPTTLSLAEASLQRIDEHTAAIDLKITAHINSHDDDQKEADTA